MFMVNGLPVDGDPGLVQLIDLAQREVFRSFGDAVGADPVPPLRGSRYRVLGMVPAEGGRRLTDLATVADMTKQAMGEFVAELADSLQGLPQHIRLILDDVHELVSPEALYSVQTFIRVMPATVRLVLASRFDPPLSLPRFLASQGLQLR